MRDDTADDRDALEARMAALADELKAARAQAAAYALALDVLGRVDGTMGPAAIADTVVQLFTALFAPGDVRLSIVDPCDYAFSERPGPAAAAGPVFEPRDDCDGFRVRLVHEGRIVGTLDVGRLALPEYRDRYENTALAVAPIAAMLLVHARSLHGLIAICAYCKRIRDGQGTWHVLEEYLSEHSEALFSHGVCPACIHDASVADDGGGERPARQAVQR